MTQQHLQLLNTSHIFLSYKRVLWDYPEKNLRSHEIVILKLLHCKIKYISGEVKPHMLLAPLRETGLSKKKIAPLTFSSIKALSCWLRCWISNPGVPYSKPLGGSKVNSAFHPYKVHKMSTSNIYLGT